MTRDELVAALREGMERRPEADRSDDDLVFTFVSTTARGLGIRPIILAVNRDNRVLGVDRKTAARWLKKLGA